MACLSIVREEDQDDTKQKGRGEISGEKKILICLILLPMSTFLLLKKDRKCQTEGKNRKKVLCAQ